MWVRGLKHLTYIEVVEVKQSHPMWVRGLKLQLVADIEERMGGRTLCGCGD